MIRLISYLIMLTSFSTLLFYITNIYQLYLVALIMVIPVIAVFKEE